MELPRWRSLVTSRLEQPCLSSSGSSHRHGHITGSSSAPSPLPVLTLPSKGTMTRGSSDSDSVFRTPPAASYDINRWGLPDIAASDLHGDGLTATAGCRCDKCSSSPFSSTFPRWLGRWIHRCGGRRRVDLGGAMVMPPPPVLPPIPEAGAVMTGDDNELLL
uniref:Uncharacterized protein n=2 Tax=Oryza punctata TaxID=4537 RepID=A0A0E0K5M8_ORYPU